MAATMCVRSMSKVGQLSRSILFRNSKTRPAGYQLYTTTETKAEESKFAAENVKAETANGGQAADTNPEVKEAGPTELEKKLTEENEKFQADLKELKDKYMRSLAETENVRTRMKKQVDDAKVFGIQGFCKDLLEVADILNQATESTPKEELARNNHLKTLFEGLTLTNSQLVKVFNRHGLSQVVPEVGEKFDPFLHEALFEVPAQGDNEGGTIAIIQKTGYQLHERTLRPALVGVFKSAS